MKRCPQCNRVESDDALAFCRADGTALVSESGSIGSVMPFVNESGNTDLEYLSDGMTETLINSLSQLPSLSVKAHSTVFHFKGKGGDTATSRIGIVRPGSLKWSRHTAQRSVNLES